MKLEPIDDIKNALKFWSVKLSLACSLIFGVLSAMPEAILWAWNQLPDEFKALIPEQYLMFITAMLFLLNIILRITKQTKLVKDDENN